MRTAIGATVATATRAVVVTTLAATAATVVVAAGTTVVVIAATGATVIIATLAVIAIPAIVVATLATRTVVEIAGTAVIAVTMGAATLCGRAVDAPHAGDLVAASRLAAAGALAAAAVVLAVPVCIASLLVVAIVMGLAGAAASTAVETFPRYLTNDEALLARVNSLNSVVTFAAVIAGPLLAGAIADVTDSRLVFAVLPVTSVLGVLVALRLRERVRLEHPQDSGQTVPSLLARVANGVRATVASPALIVLFAVCFLGNLGFGAFDSLESLFYRDVLRVGAEWMGWLTAIVGVGATVGSLLAARVPARRVTLPALCGLLVAEGLGAVLYTATPFVWCAAAGQLVLGAANGLIMPLRVTLTQRNCELGHLGSVGALMRVGISVSGTLPLLVAPLLADAFGVQAVLVSAAALVAFTGAALVAAARRVREG